ncbi:MAG: protein kinase [Acidobacteria bacterium]|nr:protein kinase [Acidobacteriota bacterium]MCL5289086.1 protein kinase [Acidobacteriota bacterium]
MIGKKLSHYKILEQLGAGGMGVVYRAQDERLERDVALKVLPADALANEDARKRFRKEALALSKLNHPNIATVFDFDHAEGRDFLAMELIAGESLATRLERGPLNEKEATGVGAQIAAALEEAHERGVIHRDLKPGNVMVTPKGHVKVLDFGLAKLLRAPTEADATRSITETHAVSGTLPYMAPEQLSGEALDARADIHALGAVLYETATGQRAFREQSVPRLTDAILHQLPVPARAVNPRLSSELERIILKCLEKDPGNRYQSAKEVAVDLRRLASPTSAATLATAVPMGWSRRRVARTAGMVAVAAVAMLVVLNVGGWRDRLLGRTAGPQIHSLAVLPLENLSGDVSQDYFADGMTEALITEMAQLGGLRKVTLRTSVMRFKKKDKSMPEIAKDLGVDAIIDGSVQRAGDKVGITVQLIDPVADRHLWAKSYERDARDILSLQREVARAIADEIKIKLTPQEQSRLDAARPVNPKAHNAYLLGRFYTEKRDHKSLEKAVETLTEAIRIDPQFAPAYAALSRAYAEREIWGGVGLGATTKEKREAAEKAVQLDPGLAEAHFALAASAFDDWDWEKALAEYQRTFELNHNFPEALHIYAFALQTLGRHEEAISTIHRAVELAPTAVGFVDSEGRILYRARRYDAAIARFQQALEMDPSYPPVYQRLADAYIATGRANDALAILDKGKGISDPLIWTERRAYVYAKMGRRQEALAPARVAEKEGGVERAGVYELASVYAALGDRDRAMSWLEKAAQNENSAGLHPARSQVRPAAR